MPPFAEYHEWLLSDEVDILPRILLPLAGPEEFDEDDMEKLPEDLQYLEPEKRREEDPDIRKMLVETVFQVNSNFVNLSYSMYFEFLIKVTSDSTYLDDYIIQYLTLSK